MAKQSKFSKLQKGEYFRFVGKCKVYVFDGGGKVRGFRYTSAEDINDCHKSKTDRVVETGFTY
jgi:hypothetical protein